MIKTIIDQIKKLKNEITILVVVVSLLSFITETNAQCTAGFTFDSSNDPTIVFTSTSSGGGSQPHYFWNFNDGNVSTQQYSTHTFTYAGTYNVCLNYQDTINPCTSDVCHTVTITNAPHVPCVTDFYYHPDSIQTNQVAFTDISVNPVKWLWNFGDGTTDTVQNPVHQYSSGSNYYVCHTVINSLGDTCISCDSISAMPCSQRLNVGYTYALNSDGNVTFNSNSSGALNPRYNWNFEYGTSQIPNPSNTYSFNGTYNVCLTYSDTNVCAKSFCDTITITNAIPYSCNPFYTYTPDYSILPNTINFFDQSTTQFLTNWAWSFGDGDSLFSQNPVHTYAATGSYNVCLTNTNQAGVHCSYCNTVNVGTNCTNTSADFTLTADSVPHVWHVINMSSGAQPINYLWSWGDSTTSTGVNPTHTYSVDGYYTICLTVTDVNNCSAFYCLSDTLREAQSMITVYVTSQVTGINDLPTVGERFVIYPNPSNSSFTIKLPTKQSFLLSVIDITGRNVYENKNALGTVVIDATDFGSGVYFVKAVNEKMVLTHKLIKQ